MQAGIAQLGDVVGRDVRRHAHSDTGRAVGQQVGEGRGQHHRFGQGAIVIIAEIDGVFGQPFQQRLGHRGHPRLGIPARRRVIPVDVTEIPLPVDQRVAHGKILRQPRHRVVDRRVAMRVIVAHDVAADLGRLSEPPGGT